jgi:hypothetical protein
MSREKNAECIPGKIKVVYRTVSTIYLSLK